MHVSLTFYNINVKPFKSQLFLKQPNELGNVGGKTSGNASILVPKKEEVVSKYSLGPSSHMGARRITKAKSSKTEKSVVQEAKLGKVSVCLLDVYDLIID